MINREHGGFELKVSEPIAVTHSSRSEGFRIEVFTQEPKKA